MQSSRSFRPFLVAAVLLVGSAVTLAHHVGVPLSSIFGTEVMTELTYFTKAGNVGVPPYSLGGDHHAYVVPENSSFTVSDGKGGFERVSFPAGTFADPAHVEPEAIVNAVNAQLGLATALVDNSTLMLRGVEGGSGARLMLTDGPGAPLAALGLLPGTVMGADDVEFTLSIPAEDHGDDHEGGQFAHHPYLAVMSTTEGVTGVGGVQVPIAIDATTLLGLRATQFGAFPGSLGVLDEDEDATATFDRALLAPLFPGGRPERIHYSFVVFDEGVTTIEFASNRFDVVIEG
jgi:hypothetical protein